MIKMGGQHHEHCNGVHHHHDHHGHHHGDESLRNLTIAFILNAGFAIIELIGGWWTNSVAIQADAIHDFGDSLAIAAALGLQFLSNSSANGRYTFGFKRLSLLSALATSAVLLIGGLFMISKGLTRLANPQSPQLDGMFALAILGVAVNGYAAWKIGRGGTQNERALSWHMIEDLLGWVAVLVSSIVMRFVDVPWLDAILCIVIAGIVIIGAARNFWGSTQYFLQAAPKIDLDKVKQVIGSFAGIKDVRQLTAWSLDGLNHVASVHAIISPDLTPEQRRNLKDSIRKVFSENGKFQVTIEWDED
jgi:cobalt-zinc-cadmium efflux system protein